MTRWIAMACLGFALAACSSTTTVVQGTSAPSASTQPDVCLGIGNYQQVVQNLVSDRPTMTNDEMVTSLNEAESQFNAAAAGLQSTDAELASSLQAISTDVGNLKVDLDSGTSFTTILTQWAPPALRNLKDFRGQGSAISTIQSQGYCASGPPTS